MAWGALGVALGAAGCGVPTDGQARVVPVEVGLQYAVTPIPTTPPGITEQASGIVYFIDVKGDTIPVDRSFETTRIRFANSQREVEQNQKEALAKGLVEQLLDGPTPRESSRGIRTYWPGDVSVLDVEITVAGTAIVKITEESRFEVSPIDERRAASSELVFTLTELPGVEGVRLTSPTRDLRLVTDEGPAAALAPVSRGQFGREDRNADDERVTPSPTESQTPTDSPNPTASPRSTPPPGPTASPEPTTS